MASVNEVLIKLAADSAALVAGLNKGQDALARFDAGMSKVRAGLGLLTGVAVINWLASFAKATIDEADALNDLSKRTGASVRDLASLKLAAEQNGTSLDALAKSMGKLNLSFSQGMNGSKEQAESLNNLGIKSSDAKERFYQLAEAYVKSGGSAAIHSDIQKVLGKSYSEMVPLLELGGKGLREMANGSKAYADQMARMAPQADRLNDQLALLKQNASLASSAILSELIPSLNEWIAVGIEVSQTGDWLDKLRFFALGNASDEMVEKVRAAQKAQEKDRQAAERTAANRRLQAEAEAKNRAAAEAARKKRIANRDAEFAFAMETEDKRQAQELSNIKQLMALENERTQAFLDDWARKDALMAQQWDREEAHGERVKKITKELSAALTEKGIMPRLDVYARANEQTEAFLKPMREQVYALEGSPEWAAILEAWNALSKAAYQMSDTEAAMEALGKVEAERQNRLSVLSAERTAGIKGETDAHNEGLAINRTALDGMQAHIDKLKALATTGYPPAIEAMRKYQAVLIDLKNQATDKTWMDGITQGLKDYAGQFNDTFSSVRNATIGAFKSMEDALVSFVMKGKLDFKSLANSIVADMIRIQIQQNITRPLATAIGFMTPWAQGGVPGGPGLSAYRNTVVSRPTTFAFANGAGLMGEAGPEAIMPLTRTRSGDLGVRVENDATASRGDTVNISFTVNAIDTQSALGVIMSNKAAIVGMVQSAFNKAGRMAPMIA